MMGVLTTDRWRPAHGSLTRGSARRVAVRFRDEGAAAVRARWCGSSGQMITQERTTLEGQLTSSTIDFAF